MKSLILNIYKLLLQVVLEPLLRFEHKKPVFREINERAVEYAFVFRWLSRISPRTILDVGTGQGSLPHLMANCGFKVTSIDNKGRFWKQPFFNRHFRVIKDDITKTKLTEKFDMITCISVLEHIPNDIEAVECMVGLLKPRGYLILTFPYNHSELISDVYNGERHYFTRAYNYDRMLTITSSLQIIDRISHRFWSGSY